MKCYKYILDNKLFLFSFPLLFLFSLFTSLPSASIFFDEGWVATIGNEISEKKVLYKDTSAPYGPVSFYLYALIISLFGKQFIYFRFIGLIIISLQSFFVFRIMGLFTKNKYLIAITAILSFVTLASYQGSRISASTISALITLMIVFFHLSYLFNNKNWKLILIGGLFFLSLLTKHNIFLMDVFGNGMLIILILFKGNFLNKKYKFSYLLMIFLSFIFFMLLYVAMIFPYYDIVLKDTVGIISTYKGSDIVIPFPTLTDIINSNLTKNINSVFLYSIIPFIISAILIIYHSFKFKNSNRIILLFLFALTFFHYCLVYPLNDYSHYVRATVLYPVAYGFMLLYIRRHKYYLPAIFLSLSLILHLYKTPHNIYSNLSQIKSNNYSELPFHKFIFKPHNEELIMNLLNEINKLPKEEDILVVGHANFLYYLSGRTSIFRSSLVTHHYMDEIDQQILIDKLKSFNVPLVIQAPTIRKDNDLEQLKLLNNFVKNNYVKDVTINNFIFWKKL